MQGGFPGGSRVKNLPANAGDTVRSLGGEDPLEKEITTHSSTLAWRIPWTEEPGRLHSPWGCKESDMTEWLSMRSHVLCIIRIMDTGKSQGVCKMSQQTGDPGQKTKFQSESEGLRTSRTDGISLVQEQEKTDIPAWQSGRRNLFYWIFLF